MIKNQLVNLIYKRLFWLPLALAFGLMLQSHNSFADDSQPTSEANEKTKLVIVTGVAETEDQAMKNAAQNAVKEVVGMYVVSNSAMEKDNLIKDEVLTLSNGYVRNFRKISSVKDEDGLFEVKAAVTVQESKLTNKLKEMNIGLKEVGTSSFKIKGYDKLTNARNFKKMLKTVVFDPILVEHNAYNPEIIDFQELDTYIKLEDIRVHIRKDEQELWDNGDLVPYQLTFKAGLTNEYLEFVESFFESAAKKTETINIAHERIPFYGAVTEFQRRVDARTDIPNYDPNQFEVFFVDTNFWVSNRYKSLHPITEKNYPVRLQGSTIRKEIDLNTQQIKLLKTAYFSGKESKLNIKYVGIVFELVDQDGKVFKRQVIQPLDEMSPRYTFSWTRDLTARTFSSVGSKNNITMSDPYLSFLDQETNIRMPIYYTGSDFTMIGVHGFIGNDSNSFYFVKNNNPYTTIVYLTENDISRLKDIKIYYQFPEILCDKENRRKTRTEGADVYSEPSENAYVLGHFNFSAVDDFCELSQQDEWTQTIDGWIKSEMLRKSN